MQHRRLSPDPPNLHPHPSHLQKKKKALQPTQPVGLTQLLPIFPPVFGSMETLIFQSWWRDMWHRHMSCWRWCLLRGPIAKVDRNILTFSHPDGGGWRGGTSEAHVSLSPEGRWSRWGGQCQTLSAGFNTLSRQHISVRWWWGEGSEGGGRVHAWIIRQNLTGS